MAITERLALIIDADGKGAVRELEKVGKTAEREIGKAESSLDKWGSKMTSVGTVMVAGAAVVGTALWSASQATSDLAEAADYSGRVFGEASGEIEAFAESAEAIGLSERAAHEAVTTFGDLLKATGATKSELADMSVEMTQLAADMASAKNTTPEDAIEALGAALRGESEPIRRYGVMLDDATLKQKALDMGLVETTKGTLPLSIKMQAAYAAILDQTAGMQGNFADTADSAANKQRVMTAQIENAKATIGEGFLPVMASAIGMVSGAADAFGGLNEQTGGAIGQFAAVGTVVTGVGGALAVAGGQAISLANAFKASAFASTTAGAAMTAAFGPAAVAIAALTATYLTFQAKVNQSDGAQDAMLATIDASIKGADSAEELYRKEAALVEGHNDLVENSGKSVLFWRNAEAQANADASHETGKRIEETQRQIAIMEGLAAQTGESKDSALAWLQAQEASGTVFKDTEQALSVYNAQMEASGQSAEAATIAQAKLNEAYDDAVTDLGKLISKVDEYYGRLDAAIDPQVKWEAAIDNMTSTISENGLAWDYVRGRLDITTEAGRENLEAFREQRDAAVDLGQAVLEQGGTLEEATRVTLGHVDALKAQWRQAGYSEAQIGSLIATLGLTPEQVTTAINQPGMGEAIYNAQTLDWLLRNMPKIVETQVKVSGAVGSTGSWLVGALSGERAVGGQTMPGKTYLVGERGPELWTSPGVGSVMPANETAAVLGGAQTPVVNVYIGDEQVQAKVSTGLIRDKRARAGWQGVGS